MLQPKKTIIKNFDFAEVKKLRTQREVFRWKLEKNGRESNYEKVDAQFLEKPNYLITRFARIENE